MDATAATQRLKDLALSDSGFLFDPYSGATFSVNESGMLILRGLKDGLDRDAILAALGEHFDVRGDDLARDLDEFVRLLRNNALLPVDFDFQR